MSLDTASEIEQSQPEVLVKVENAGKVFCRDLKKSLFYGLKDSLRDLLCFSPREEINSNNRQLRSGEFWANKDVSFELRRGECLGLIGHNGAGKTTLLKMLNGLIKPDAGKIEMRGRVGALIALGAGFNPILSGRENIYINGSVLGFSKKEIDEQIADIIEFAQIDDFIDAPVQSYSSGMQVRLGFAIASSLEPDILILDEVLAVGDIGFTVKCLNRIRELASDCAVIFVSHNMQYISTFCTRVLVMADGRVLMDAGNPSDGINCYFAQMKLEGTETGSGGGKLENFDIRINGCRSEPNPEIQQGEEVAIDVSFSTDSSCGPVSLRIVVSDEAGAPIISFPLIGVNKDPIVFNKCDNRVNIPLGCLNLNTGNYSFTFGIFNSETKINLLRKSGVAPFRIKSAATDWAKIVKPITVHCDTV